MRQMLLYRTNLPKEVMAFPDFPFPAVPESFLSHQAVLQYMCVYAQRHGLYPHIRVSICVTMLSVMDSIHTSGSVSV